MMRPGHDQSTPFGLSAAPDERVLTQRRKDAEAQRSEPKDDFISTRLQPGVDGSQSARPVLTGYPAVEKPLKRLNFLYFQGSPG
jgi:hypothetical protein